jgi:hypothetical protein
MEEVSVIWKPVTIMVTPFSLWNLVLKPLYISQEITGQEAGCALLTWLKKTEGKVSSWKVSLWSQLTLVNSSKVIFAWIQSLLCLQQSTGKYNWVLGNLLNHWISQSQSLPASELPVMWDNQILCCLRRQFRSGFWLLSSKMTLTETCLASWS